MDINASLVDQRVRQVVENHRDALARGDARVANDPPHLASRAFVALCVQALLDVSLEEAIGLLTDGAQDLAIDALRVDLGRDIEFDVTLFQGKYRQSLDGDAAFPANEVLKVARTVGVLFDPNKPVDARTSLAATVEEIRGLVRDGYLPRVRVVLCNNGRTWAADGQAHIDGAGFPPDQVGFEHFNHTALVDLLRAPKRVDDTLRLAGQAIVEPFDFRRVLVGKMRVAELAALIERHGERLLERNIRRYLGLGQNRINQAISETLRDPSRRKDFYFFNNGVTFTCSQFSYNALQESDYQARVKDLQIINGGQTCVTIHRALAGLDPADFDATYVMVRVYELEDDDRDVVRAITYATNNQNPVDLRDLRANNEVQVRLELGLEPLGYSYIRKRGQPTNGHPVIRPAEAAEAVMSVVRGQPHVARFQAKALFGPLYDTVFAPDLAPAQVALAVEILRRVEGAEIGRDPIDGLPDPPRWLPYGTQAVAFLVGEALDVATTDHRNFTARLRALDDQFQALYRRALDFVDLTLLLDGLNVARESLQRLSATFRRGDLLTRRAEMRDRALALRDRVRWADQLADVVDRHQGDEEGMRDELLQLLARAPEVWRDPFREGLLAGMLEWRPVGAAWIVPLADRLFGAG